MNELIGVHCTLELPAHHVITRHEFQHLFKEAKNKQEKIKACIDTLASMGYCVEGWELFEEYLK